NAHIKYTDPDHIGKKDLSDQCHMALVKNHTIDVQFQILLQHYESHNFHYYNHIPYNTFHDLLKYDKVLHVIKLTHHQVVDLHFSHPLRPCRKQVATHHLFPPRMYHKFELDLVIHCNQ